MSLIIAPVSSSVVFAQSFTTAVTVEYLARETTPEGETVEVIRPATGIVVVPSKIDSGVSVNTGLGSVTISGVYTSGFDIRWYYLGLNGRELSSLTPPEIGTYSKVYRVDSPTVRTIDVVYSITADQGSGSHRQTVEFNNYNLIADLLKNLLRNSPQ